MTAKTQRPLSFAVIASGAKQSSPTAKRRQAIDQRRQIRTGFRQAAGPDDAAAEGFGQPPARPVRVGHRIDDGFHAKHPRRPGDHRADRLTPVAVAVQDSAIQIPAYRLALL